MPYNYTPKNDNVYLPKAGTYQSAWNARNKSVLGSSNVFNQQQFLEPEGDVFVEGGRAGIKGGDIMSDIIRMPAGMLEAPLRPFQELTGGGVGEALGGLWQGFKDVPVLGLAAHGIEGAVGVLDAENKMVRARINENMATMLRDNIGRNPNEMIEGLPAGAEMTVGEFRQKVASQWAVNEFTGEEFTLEQLEEMAANDVSAFGEFATDENGLMGFAKEMLLSPSNIALGSGVIGSLIRGISRATRAAKVTTTGARVADWAAPIRAPLSRAVELPRIGRGALERIRPDFAVRPEYVAVREFLDSPLGRLGALPLTGLLRVGQKVYAPGYAALRRPSLAMVESAERVAAEAAAKGVAVPAREANILSAVAEAGGRTGAGMGRARAAAVAYQRGGLQQMAATSGAEHLMNAINEREYDEEGGPLVPANGWADNVHDLLHAINNSHPLSDSDTFVVLSLFSPWPDAVGSAWQSVKGARRNPERYYTDTVQQMNRNLSELTGANLRTVDDTIAGIIEQGRADIDNARARGLIDGTDEEIAMQAIRHLLDDNDSMLVANQFSGFTNAAVTTIEGKLHRAAFMDNLVGQAVARKRANGALRPKSLAETVIRRYREGDLSPEIRGRQGLRTITAENFLRDIVVKYIGDTLTVERLGMARGIIVKEGLTVTKPIMNGISRLLDQLPPDDVVPREVAAMLIERNPTLMHENEFWNELALTLGQRLDKTGKIVGREALPQGTEGITVRELKERVDDYMNELPDESELFHESEAAQRQVMEASQVREVLGREVDPDMPARMRAFRERFVNAATHATNIRNKVARIKSKEFTRSGKPRFSTAKTLKGHFGNTFERIGDRTFRKQVPFINLNRVRDQWPNTYLPDGQLPTGPVVDMMVIGNDLDTHHIPAAEAVKGFIGDKEVYIFKPVSTSHVISIGGAAAPSTPTVPKIYKTIPNMGDVPSLESLDPDKWYVMRTDGNGLLLTNRGYTSAQRAANATQRSSPMQVTTSVIDGVIEIDGKLPIRKPGPLMSADEAEEFARNMDEILARVWQEWQDAGREEAPGSIHRVNGDPLQFARNETTDSVHLYHAGPDGLPDAVLSVDRVNGQPEAVNIYVAPESRGGGVARSLYDEAFRQGIDLSNISGINNTPKGRAFTDKYWANRRDTLDTEALQLAIEHGGRIIEQPVRQPITVTPNVAKLSQRLDMVDMQEFMEWLMTNRDYKGPMDDIEDFAGMDELIVDGRIRGQRYEYNDEEVILIQDWSESIGVTDIVHLDKDKNIIEMARDVEWEDYEATVTRMLKPAPEELIPGGLEHAETLARWGFHEVARYGEPTPAPQVFVGRDARYSSGEFHERGYVYRIDKIGSLDRIKRSGLSAGLTRLNEAYGIYVADDASAAAGLVPPRIGEKALVLRMKEADFPEGQRDNFYGDGSIKGGDRGPGNYPNEQVLIRKVRPDEIEYYGSDGKWHNLADTGERAVFAYRGGDTTQSILNSRVPGANPPYKPSTRRTGAKNPPRYIRKTPAVKELSRDIDPDTGVSNEHMFAGENAERIWEIDTDQEAYVYLDKDPVIETQPYRLWTQHLELIGEAYPTFATLDEAIASFAKDVPNPDFNIGLQLRGRKAALNLARKRANDASLLYPTLDTLGRGYSNSRRFFSPEERRLHLNELMENLDAQVTSQAESIKYFDDTVETISGLKKVTRLDQWFERALPEEINKLVDTVKNLNRDYPGMSLQEGQVFADPRVERFGHLTTTHSILKRMSFDYGFLSPIGRFFDALEPHSSVWLAKEAHRELETQMSALGFNAKQVDRIYDGIRETIARSRSSEGYGSLIGSYLYRNARAIPEGQLRGIIEDAAGKEHLNRIIGRYGSVHRMITESSAQMLRRSAERARMGGKVGRLEAAVNTAFRHWQYDPGVRVASGATHMASKFFYPLVRFFSDPLFAAMNLIEPYMYGISRNGISNALRRRSRHQQQMNERVFRESQRSSIPAGGFYDKENLPIEILLQDNGMFTMPRNIKPNMLADFEVTRLDQLTDALKAIPENDPLARIFQERFGAMDGDNWARGMEDVMFGFMDESIEGVTRTQFKEYFDELGFTQDEMLQLAPFANRVAEMYRGMADDLVDLYVGRMRRSTVERVIDNFWLFWPTSYIVKATTWLASIMTKRVGGMNIGAGGAYLYNEYRDRFLRAMENDEDMQAWMEDNRDFMFLFEMLFPITPESIGISLNPAIRIGSSWINANTINSPELQNLFGDYSYIESVPEGVERTMRFGPIRTWNLFRRLMNSMDVPGWTYESGGGRPAPSQSRADFLP